MRYLCLLCIYLFLGGQTATSQQTEFLHPENNQSLNGQFKLEWSSGETLGSREYILQLARSSDFSDTRQVYKGADHQHYVSGLRNGEYYYRVRIVNTHGEKENWSQTFKLTVEHQSLFLAGSLFILGLIVSISTAIVIVRGNKADREAADV